MFLQEITEQLKQHAARFDLEQRAIEACKRCLRNLLGEDPEEARFHLRGVAIEDLAFEFQKHQLVFEGRYGWPHILSQVNVGRVEEESIEVFGLYYLETVEDGEISDDWFWWEQMRDEEGKLTEFSRVLE